MRTSQAARYARWAAAAAILLAASVAVVFAYRSWQAAQLRKHAPPAVPPTVQQRSAGFSFSKVEQDRTLFTVRASRATEFKEGKKNLLEDVWISIYGREGQRFDNIHTQACDYISDTGRIVCAGEVQMDLESAEEARQHPGQRVFHVATSNVSFDRDTGEARSEQPVVFRFPYGQGRGVSLTYSSRNAVVRLHRDVEMTLSPSAVPGASRPGQTSAPNPAAEPLTLTGGALEYRRDDRTLRLLAPVRGRQGQRELVAGELALEFDAELRARRLVASRQPELRSTEPRGQVVLSADEFLALLHPGGWTERIQATGNVRARVRGESGEDRLAAERAELEMLPRRGKPRELIISGSVTAQSDRRGESRRLETSALRLFFAASRKPGELRLDRGETMAPATIELSGPSAFGGKTATLTTRLRAQQVTAEFGERNQLRQLTGHDGVEVERRLPGRPLQVSTAREMVAKFDPGGDWIDVEQSGGVRFREADRTAQADRARFERASDSATLVGSVVLVDPLSRTTAQVVSFNQHTGEIRANSDVRTAYSPTGRNAITNLAPQPAYISSDHLLANSLSGRAVYSGAARLWQGDAVIEADSIELVRDSRLLNARGKVRAVFPQAAGSPSGSPATSKVPVGSSKAAPDLWRVRAGTLTYWSADARAYLEQDVTAQSRQGLISSRTLELFFSSAGSPVGGGAQQLTRAVASGGATVRQGARWGTAERAEYTAAEGKFVLSGGRPTLYDASGGTTTGHQLTFFFASDTIIVDSGEGVRTRTKHRVEK